MFARTPRLLLRPGWPEDAQALYAAIADEAIVRNLARAPWPYTLDDAVDFLAGDHDPLQPKFLVMKRTQGIPRLIGSCGIHTQDDGALELGYWIARPYWGLGFATEAASAVMQIARATGVRNIRASHFTDNPASGRVLRKLGFRPAGRPEPRHSRGRNRADLCQFYEEGGEGDMREDVAVEIYADREPVAA
ncbi:RimJ/RimL family protein N-acetyltransferase [Sphingobium sp. B2D3A]|uniref:GNAT family N-acetyltransferase n=1 Tax=unclassified Sphingobium TaxID=2611147 RepID=UPI00222420A8|nr:MULTISPECIES: GNAT family N-acetyltransferase [unclassified Sphingobium]MCW2336227.1 RimJ/RimL family protein N-acetyltransferase [Sphingobium sp. B2D3A]MCW2385982.1 RimJ/RimL family protein N-acetyltransferase [Sphingobium sp. B2D3D]